MRKEKTIKKHDDKKNNEKWKASPLIKIPKYSKITFELHTQSKIKNDLSKLKIIKAFSGRHNSEYVYLLENDIIKKKYSPSNPLHVDHFNREIRILNHLRKYPYVTKLLHVDFKNMIIYQTYCGPRPNKTTINAMKIRERAQDLHKNWGIVRRQGNSAPIYNIFFGNTAIKDGEIYFFDFGGDRWHIE